MQRTYTFISCKAQNIFSAFCLKYALQQILPQPIIRFAVSIKICYSVYIVSFAPKFPIPVCKFHVPPFLKDHQTALPFQISHESRYTHLRRYTCQHMHMIRTDFTFYDLYSFPRTQLPQNLSDLCPFLFEKYFPPIFRRKHDMILAIPLRM